MQKPHTLGPKDQVEYLMVEIHRIIPNAKVSPLQHVQSDGQQGILLLPQTEGGEISSTVSPSGLVTAFLKLLISQRVRLTTLPMLSILE